MKEGVTATAELAMGAIAEQNTELLELIVDSAIDNLTPDLIAQCLYYATSNRNLTLLNKLLIITNGFPPDQVLSIINNCLGLAFEEQNAKESIPVLVDSFKTLCMALSLDTLEEYLCWIIREKQHGLFLELLLTFLSQRFHADPTASDRITMLIRQGITVAIHSDAAGNLSFLINFFHPTMKESATLLRHAQTILSETTKDPLTDSREVRRYLMDTFFFAPSIARVRERPSEAQELPETKRPRIEEPELKSDIGLKRPLSSEEAEAWTKRICLMPKLYLREKSNPRPAKFEPLDLGPFPQTIEELIERFQIYGFAYVCYLKTNKQQLPFVAAADVQMSDSAMSAESVPQAPLPTEEAMPLDEPAAMIGAESTSEEAQFLDGVINSDDESEDKPQGKRRCNAF